jgi:uncharacterized protein YndB with AHSA1/START domain
MSHLSTTLRVDAPPTAVFDLLADPARAPEWQTMIAEMGEISGRPGGVGSSYTGFYKVAGRRIEGHFVVTAAERPTLHQAAGTTRGGWTRWTTMIEPVDGGSEVTVDLEYELPGEVLGSVFSAITGNRLEQEVRRTYENLKALVEAETTTGRRPPRPAASPEPGDESEDDKDVSSASFSVEPVGARTP